MCLHLLDSSTEETAGAVQSGMEMTTVAAILGGFLLALTAALISCQRARAFETRTLQIVCDILDSWLGGDCSRTVPSTPESRLGSLTAKLNGLADRIKELQSEIEEREARIEHLQVLLRRQEAIIAPGKPESAAQFIERRESYSTERNECSHSPQGSTGAGLPLVFDYDILSSPLSPIEITQILDAFDARARTGGPQFSLLLMELSDTSEDDSGRFSDRDPKVIEEVYHLIRASIRWRDLCFRYDTNRFVVLMINASADTAALVAERIRMNLALSGESFYGISVNVGVASWSSEISNGATLLKRADAALKESKRARQNLKAPTFQSLRKEDNKEEEAA